MFVIFTQSAGATEPSEGALDDPTAWQELEMGKFGAVFDDFQTGAATWTQGAHPLDEGAGVTAVGPDAAQPSETSPQGFEQQTRAIAVLHVGWVHTD